MAEADKRLATDTTLQATNTALGGVAKDTTLQATNTALGLLAKDATLSATNTALGNVAKDTTLAATNTALGALGKDTSLIAIKAAIEALPNATQAAADNANAAATAATNAVSRIGGLVAVDYSDSATYAVGDYAYYNGYLYRCKAAITTAETWTAAHWTQVHLGDDVASTKDTIVSGDIVFGTVKAGVESSGFVNFNTGVMTDYHVSLSRTGYVYVSGGGELTFPQYYSGESAGYAFYDASKNFVSGGGLVGSAGDPITVNIPASAVYFACTVRTNNISEFSVTWAGGDIQAAVSDLGKLMDGKFMRNVPVTFVDGMVNAGTGEMTSSHVSLSRTGHIYIYGGQLTFPQYYSGENAGYAFYNADKEYISGGALSGNRGSAITVTPPANAVYFAVTCGDSDTGSFYLTEVYTVTKIAEDVATLMTESAEDIPENILKGKKWAVCGDSFTAGADSGFLPDGIYAGQKIVYPYIIGNRTGVNILRFFQNGRTLAFPAEPGDFVNSLTCPTADYYYQNIPADVDYITIYLGINDKHHEDSHSEYEEDTTGYIPLGSITDNTTASHYGAWNVVMTWLRANRPFAHIGIIVSNSTSEEYRAAQIAIAQKYGVPYLDMNGDRLTPCMGKSCNTDIPTSVRNAISEAQAVEYGVNGHPNNAAHRFESTFIENFLRSL